jgi:hypothetical protein
VSAAVLFGAGIAVLAAGCGSSKQDAGEPERTYPVKVVQASFPKRQSIARPEDFQLRITNTGTHTVPNLAVTLDSFSYNSAYPQLAARKRPIWVVEVGPGPGSPAPVESQEVSPPGGAQTAYVNTWAFGPLEPGGTQTLVWKVVPVKAGHYTVHYKVAGGLAGKAKAQLRSGRGVEGQLTADIAPVPPATHVDPQTGQVVEGKYPASP